MVRNGRRLFPWRWNCCLSVCARELCAVRAVPVIVWRRTRQPRFPPRKGAPRVASRTARQSRDCLRVRPLSDPPPLHGAARLAGAFFATVGTGARRFSARLHSARMLAHPSGSAHRLAAPSGALRAGSLRSKLLRCISPNLPSAALRCIPAPQNCQCFAAMIRFPRPEMAFSLSAARPQFQ